MAGQKTIAQTLREQYPGDYDDLTDQELEAMALAKAPDRYGHLARTPEAPTEDKSLRVLGKEVTFLPDAVRDAAVSYGKAGPGRVKQGFGEVMEGEFAKGGHDILAGAATTALPMMAAKLAPSVIRSPASTLTQTAGTVAGATAAGAAGAGLASAAGASDDQQALIGDLTAVLGGGAGLRTTRRIQSFLRGAKGPEVMAMLESAARMPTEEAYRKAYSGLSAWGAPDWIARPLATVAQLRAGRAATPAAEPVAAAQAGPPPPAPAANRTGTQWGPVAVPPRTPPVASVPRGTSAPQSGPAYDELAGSVRSAPYSPSAAPAAAPTAPPKTRYAHGDPDAPAWLMKDAKPGDFRAMSPQAVTNELAATARRAGVSLTPKQFTDAAALVRGGQSPVDAVKAVAALDAQAGLLNIPGAMNPAQMNAEIAARVGNRSPRR